MSNENMQHKANRLANEKSPYLLQHAYNPVDWYPWGDEAFEKAKAEDKPIFLSIGYSTCHWCHVMERESFEDEEVAEVLNRSFVAIKVDREERPDIDHIYMTVCQALTGHGGWPLSIFMTPDKRPFYSGTYFPKKNRMGMQGFISILQSVDKAWKWNRNELMDTSQKIIDALKRNEGNEAVDIDNDIVHEAFDQFKRGFDKIYGGFKGAPKFPTPHNLYFLIRYWYVTKDQFALDMALKTLDSMYKGGIYDHIGYGFSRYSTDSKWLVPHFEKMLYDNALLAIAYLEAYQATKNQSYAKVAEEIFAYVLRDMTSKEGGFYSAEDADSEGVEGKFYVWSPKEVKNVLGEVDGEKFCLLFDITDRGNFEGENIPNLIKTSDFEEHNEFIDACRKKLFEHREKRIHPHKDDKILTAWNGLMIAALSMGGRILNNEKYTKSAERAADFIFKKLIRDDGRLLARFRDGEAAYPGYVDDYAFLIWGLIELYEGTFNTDYLKRALDLNGDLFKYFWDADNGGLYVYGSDAEELLTRPKEIYDGAAPSGNSVSAFNLLRLARLTGKSELENRAEELLRAFGSELQNYPSAFVFSLISILFLNTSSQEVIIVDDEEGKEAPEMLTMINSEFRPFLVTLLYSNKNERLSELAPFTKNYSPKKGLTTAYVCQNFGCLDPVTSTSALKQILQ